jgi:hypothetical protein
MQMTLPKTDITVKTAGTHLELQLPETFMSMLAGTTVESPNFVIVNPLLQLG